MEIPSNVVDAVRQNSGTRLAGTQQNQPHTVLEAITKSSIDVQSNESIQQQHARDMATPVIIEPLPLQTPELTHKPVARFNQLVTDVVFLFPLADMETFTMTQIRQTTENFSTGSDTVNLYNPMARAADDKVVGCVREAIDPIFNAVNTLNSKNLVFVTDRENAIHALRESVEALAESLREKFVLPENQTVFSIASEDVEGVTDYTFGDFCRIRTYLNENAQVIDGVTKYHGYVYVTVHSPALMGAQKKVRMISQTVNILRSQAEKYTDTQAYVYFPIDPIYMQDEEIRATISELFQPESVKGGLVFTTNSYILENDVLPDSDELLADVVGGKNMLLFAADLRQEQSAE